MSEDQASGGRSYAASAVDRERDSFAGKVWAMFSPMGRAAPLALHWLVLRGLLAGVLYTGLYRASWRLFGEVAGVRLMPALTIWLLDVVWFSSLAILAVGKAADQWAANDDGKLLDAKSDQPSLPSIGILALVVLLILKLTLWTALPTGIEGWPTDWRRHFNFLYPRPVLRPLVLAPMWGCWALILAKGVGRPSVKHDTQPSGADDSPSPQLVLGWFMGATALTALFCGRHGRWMIGCIIGLVVLAVTFVFCVAAARRFSGHTRFTVLAASQVSQVTFLAAYLVAAQYIYRH